MKLLKHTWTNLLYFKGAELLIYHMPYRLKIIDKLGSVVPYTSYFVTLHGGDSVGSTRALKTKYALSSRDLPPDSGRF